MNTTEQLDDILKELLSECVVNEGFSVPPQANLAKAYKAIMHLIETHTLRLAAKNAAIQSSLDQEIMTLKAKLATSTQQTLEELLSELPIGDKRVKAGGDYSKVQPEMVGYSVAITEVERIIKRRIGVRGKALPRPNHHLSNKEQV
jgi:hypothetical protein